MQSNMIQPNIIAMIMNPYNNNLSLNTASKNESFELSISNSLDIMLVFVTEIATVCDVLISVNVGDVVGKFVYDALISLSLFGSLQIG